MQSHTYILRNNGDRIVELKSEGTVIVSLQPGISVYFFSSYDDLEPLCLEQGIECSIESSIEVNPDFLEKCKTVTEEEGFEWKEEGF